jgi:hypothetical protein
MGIANMVSAIFESSLPKIHLSRLYFSPQSGYSHQSIPIPNLTSGVYIVTAIAGDKKVSKKLLKI